MAAEPSAACIDAWLIRQKHDARRTAAGGDVQIDLVPIDLVPPRWPAATRARRRRDLAPSAAIHLPAPPFPALACAAQSQSQARAGCARGWGSAGQRARRGHTTQVWEQQVSRVLYGCRRVHEMGAQRPGPGAGADNAFGKRSGAHAQGERARRRGARWARQRPIPGTLPQGAGCGVAPRPGRPGACLRGRPRRSRAWGSCRSTPPRAAGCRQSRGSPRLRCSGGRGVGEGSLSGWRLARWGGVATQSRTRATPQRQPQHPQQHPSTQNTAAAPTW